YGEAMAVLAGDALLTSAFSMIASADYDAETRIEAVKTLALCAGEYGMVGGQVLDILSEERQCTEQEVLDIQSRKTGALIKAACVLGVLAGGGTREQIQAAEGFADNIGLAFQIRDDMLDVIGDAKTLGKAVGTDETKNTFVQLYGLEECNTLVITYTNKALACLDAFADHAYLDVLSMQLVGRYN
ncbi:MAG: polyprenyl synthetase family protein, partial [Oscillospiraceae bacterium]|nr:polyprenyl synthetase family protein [Oscillospiraceae bacterium]